MTPEELLSHKPMIDLYLNQGLRPLSCYHFSAIFAWKDFFEFNFEIINDRLCVWAHQGKDRFLYLPPLGKDADVPTVQACFERMQKSRIGRIENISENTLRDLQGHGYNAHLKAYEYLYRRADLAGLNGQGYKSKRHDVHVFNQRWPSAEFRAYQPEDFNGCTALYKQWAEDRRKHNADPVYQAMLEENVQVHALLLRYFEPLQLIGRVLVTDGKIAGYTFGYALDNATFCVLLEITDLEKTGAAAHIFNRFCTDQAVSTFEWINTMDDFGMPQVAKTKESYHPVKKLPVYTLTKKDTS